VAAHTPSSDLSLRKEIQDYIRACEHLLSEAASADHVPFSVMERQFIQYYAEELRAHFPVPQATE
jgi:hypothetical protein